MPLGASTFEKRARNWIGWLSAPRHDDNDENVADGRKSLAQDRHPGPAAGRTPIAIAKPKVCLTKRPLVKSRVNYAVIGLEVNAGTGLGRRPSRETSPADSRRKIYAFRTNGSDWHLHIAASKQGHGPRHQTHVPSEMARLSAGPCKSRSCSHDEPVRACTCINNARRPVEATPAEAMPVEERTQGSERRLARESIDTLQITAPARANRTSPRARASLNEWHHCGHKRHRRFAVNVRNKPSVAPCS